MMVTLRRLLSRRLYFILPFVELLVGGFALCGAAAHHRLVAATTTPPPTPVPSPVPTPLLTGRDAEILSLSVWGSAALALILIACVFFMTTRAQRSASSSTSGDGSIESSQIVYGFWLIIGSLILTLAVVILTVNIFRPRDIATADVLAVITSVTGVIGTLIAAFFGVQAAGAGRAQALTALGKAQSQTQPVTTPSKLVPGFGPHAGNTRVAITGNGFAGATAVNFGASPGVNYQLVNDGLLRATTPPAPSGKNTADVTVCYDGITPPNRAVGTFYYYTIDPAHGDVGATIKISGSGFTNATGVCFAKAAGTNFVLDDPGTIHVDVPNRPDGVNAGDEVDVTVVFPVDTPTNSVTVGKFTFDH
jgi:hypothetical protein